MKSDLHVERLVTHGTFSLDGGTWEVDNNVWIVGDDRSVVVIDPAHDPQGIADAVGDREVLTVLCTHGHDDHIRAAPAFAALVSAPVALHPADRMLWDAVHPGRAPDQDLSDGDLYPVAKSLLTVVHTPGHSPGSSCLYSEELGVVFSGDTLFAGGPGATGRSYSDYPTIVASITTRLLALPGRTVVHTGHGDDTSIEAEARQVPSWRPPP